jgi:long-chain acyl-CoA synthetase
MSAIRFSHFAERNPAALAIVDPQERTYTRATLAALSNRIARGLLRSGLQVGDVIALAAPNCFEYVAVYMAATHIGLYIVPINWHLSPDEIQYVLENSRATALIAHHRFQTLIRRSVDALGAPPRLRLAIGEIEGFRTLQDLVRDEEATALPEPEIMGRPLSYTSATTGKPKGVKLPLSGAIAALDSSISSRIALGTAPEEHTQLCASMLYHGAPLETVFVALHMGHAVVLTDVASPERLLQLIERYRVTLAYIVPTVFPRLLGLSTEVRNRYQLGSLRKVVHGGAPCAVEVKRRMMEWLGPILWEAYGATEGSGTVVGPQDWLKYPGTVGRPIPGSRVKILGDDGEELPSGAVGTIYMTRFAGDRFEYLDDPEKTRACHRGDFFTVGDIGYVNAEGFLFLCDRKIDMIIRSGMKVYPAEIEGALALHPQVADCAVFGVPDELTGEAIMAVVQPVQTAVAGSELRSQILSHLAQRLSAAKLPRFVVFVGQLPREATGKLQKRRLREQYWPLHGSELPASGTAA